MKIVGINGSPRKDRSRTLQLVRAVLDGAKQEGAQTEIVDICSLDIGFCTGCETCYLTGECIHDDDAAALFAKLEEADGIVLGSPVYIDSVTAQLKRWIDRLADAVHCQLLAGKYGCSVSTAGGSKEQEVVEYLNTVLGAVGVVAIGGVGVAVSKGPHALADATVQASALGRDLASAIRTKRQYPEKQAFLDARRDYFCRLASLNKEAWKHQYEYWVDKGFIRDQ